MNMCKKSLMAVVVVGTFAQVGAATPEVQAGFLAKAWSKVPSIQMPSVPAMPERLVNAGKSVGGLVGTAYGKLPATPACVKNSFGAVGSAIAAHPYVIAGTVASLALAGLAFHPSKPLAKMANKYRALEKETKNKIKTGLKIATGLTLATAALAAGYIGYKNTEAIKAGLVSAKDFGMATLSGLKNRVLGASVPAAGVSASEGILSRFPTHIDGGF